MLWCCCSATAECPRAAARSADRRASTTSTPRLPHGGSWWSASRRRPGRRADPAAARRPARRRGRPTCRAAHRPPGYRLPPVAGRARAGAAPAGAADPRRDRDGDRRRGAYWLPPDERRGRSTARRSSTTPCCSTATSTGVRIEPTPAMPGLRARVLTGRHAAAALGDRPRRAAGHHGALVVRDGVAAPRPVRRSTFYRHTEGWLLVALQAVTGRRLGSFVDVSIRPLHQSVRPSPIFLAIVALTVVGGVLAWLAGGRRAAAGLRRGVHLRDRRLAGVAVPARVRARLHRVALRRPRRRGARLPDAEPAEVRASRCCRSCCRCCSSRSAGSACPAARCTCARRAMTPRQRTLVSLAGPAANLVLAVLLLGADRGCSATRATGVLGRGGVPGLPAGDRVRAEPAADPGPGRLRARWSRT